MTATDVPSSFAFCVCVLCVWRHSMPDPSSLTRDQAHTPLSKRHGGLLTEPLGKSNLVSSFICNQKLATIQISMNRQINKLWYIHTMEYYSSNKKEQTMAIYNTMVKSQKSLHCKKLCF